MYTGIEIVEKRKLGLNKMDMRKEQPFRQNDNGYNLGNVGRESRVSSGLHKGDEQILPVFGNSSFWLNNNTNSGPDYSNEVGKEKSKSDYAKNEAKLKRTEKRQGDNPKAKSADTNNTGSEDEVLDWLSVIKRSRELNQGRSVGSVRNSGGGERLGKASLRNRTANGNAYRSSGRKRKRHKRIKKIPFFILLLLILLLIFGIVKGFGNSSADGNDKDNKNNSSDENASVFSQEFWDSKIYVGEDIIYGTNEKIFIPRARYDSYIASIGGEQNIDRFLYYRKVANGTNKVNYIKRDSVFSVETGKTLIALSFDDGPDPDTVDEYLKILKKYNATATFFMLGQKMERYPDAVKKIVESGNEPATHTWNHKNFKKASESDVQADLQRSSEVFDNLVGYPPYLMRSPYGNITDSVKSMNKQLAMISAMWSIDTLDWKRSSASGVVDSVKANAFPGAIILMHEGKKIDLEALPQILEWLNAQGYQVVSVGELLWQIHENGEDGLTTQQSAQSAQ